MSYLHHLVIVRSSVPMRSQGIFGVGLLNDRWKCVTMEPAVGCIPPGTYNAYTHRSIVLHDAELQAMGTYELQAVPGHDHVEILPACFAGDATQGFYSDMLGKIALGRTVDTMRPPGSRKHQMALTGSRVAHLDFALQTGGVGLRVEIVEDKDHGTAR
jgi:hypothetical protein